jgi:hypothetical protein
MRPLADPFVGDTIAAEVRIRAASDGAYLVPDAGKIKSSAGPLDAMTQLTDAEDAGRG